MDKILFKKYFIILVFFLSFITSKSLKEEKNLINNSQTNYKSFVSNNNDDNGFIKLIKDNLVVTIIVGVCFVIMIVFIIIAVVCSIKISKKYKDLKTQINKVSFKTDSLRPSNNTIDDDDLLV